MQKGASFNLEAVKAQIEKGDAVARRRLATARRAGAPASARRKPAIARSGASSPRLRGHETNTAARTFMELSPCA